MASPRKSNAERAKLRTRCREALSKHIERQLGFRVDPFKVRLITGPDEPYQWSYLEEQAHLFQKHLSKHTMGAYVELLDGIGKTFEAIAVKLDASFTARIERLEHRCAALEEDRLKLVEESRRWELQATEICRLKESAEHKVVTIKADLESAQAVVQDLRQQLETSSSIVEESRKQRAGSVRDIDDVLRVLKSVRIGLCQ
ncbi:hypothetical protein K505DRAFT_354607 [Melanomma pulvis-pyrius CBS 109.77]|uniref:Uncharacterized protein n=1 Tax=Melanomma pulvis-pyrius CBS 109.77 TaxID=1314802 RepID=A0A6A6WQU5_9PLEO|nr:hypothetical protein K505DRAFT_354607 [Melanomma pulvis-pyrius CBS 109.77]